MAVTMILTMFGCASDSKKPAGDSQKVNYTPEKFEYITFYYIPSAYENDFQNERGQFAYRSGEFSGHRDGEIDGSYGTRLLRKNMDGNEYLVTVSFKCRVDINKGDVTPERYENINWEEFYLRETMNEQWTIYLMHQTFGDRPMNPMLYLLPTGDDSVGIMEISLISLTAESERRNCGQQEADDYDVLLKEILELADGISASSLTLEVVYELFDNYYNQQ